MKMDDKIIELKNAINESAQMISNQLSGVEASLLGAFVAIIASAFISNTLGIIKYWATSSFILMWIIMANSFVQMFLPLFRSGARQKQGAKTEETMNLIAESHFERFAYLFSITAKNSASIFKAIGIIFFVSFITFLMPKTYDGISITIPIISSLLFMSLPFTLHLILPKLETSDLKKGFAQIGCFSWIIIILMAFLFAVALLVLPILSVINLLPLYTFSFHTLGLFLMVIILQAITALAFINYFSSSMVIKELTVSLFNLSDILNRIKELSLNQSINDDVYQELRNNYLKAKHYEISADDSLLVNFYSLRPNTNYLSSLGTKQSTVLKSPTEGGNLEQTQKKA